MLPVLRQYAFLSTLLFNSFKREAPPDADDSGAAKPETAKAQGPLSRSAASTIGDDFARFMMEVDAPPAATGGQVETGIPETAVDITLTMHPVTRLQIVFPFRDRAANVHVEVQPGGRVHIVSHNIFDGAVGAMDGPRQGSRPQYTVAQWAGLLETTEDIGHWIEFIKARLE